MKQNLQSVMEPKPWHPDADRLTAFAEQALPQHEREQTLAHLAVCGACRETVFLAQQACPEAVAQPALARRPWFAGWNLVWPAVAAMAAVAGFSIFVRHGVRVESPAAPVTVAVAAPERQLPVPEAMAAPEPKQPAQPKKIPPALAGAVVAKMPPPPLPAAVSAPLVAVAPQNAIHGALALPKPAIAVSDGAGSLAGQGMTQQAAAPVNMPPQTQSVSAADAIGPLPPASRQTTQLRLQAPQAAPIPPQQAQLNEVVTAAGIADSLSDIPATSDSSAKFAALLPELPSHLETVSSISNGMATVAVDAGGAVFESRDEGRHWKTVEARWTGRPVSVSLEESRAAKKRDAFTAPPAAGEAALDRRRSDPTGMLGEDRAELHGTVTDPSGASVAGAKVQVRPVQSQPGSTGEGTTVQADGQGRFAVRGLSAGRYEVVVASPGFATFTRVLSLDAGVETGMSATLQVGAATETVTVESNAPVKAPAKGAAFQLTTDTGAVWVSSDGRNWKRR